MPSIGKSVCKEDSALNCRGSPLKDFEEKAAEVFRF